MSPPITRGRTSSSLLLLLLLALVAKGAAQTTTAAAGPNTTTAASPTTTAAAASPTTTAAAASPTTTGAAANNTTAAPFLSVCEVQHFYCNATLWDCVRGIPSDRCGCLARYWNCVSLSVCGASETDAAVCAARASGLLCGATDDAGLPLCPASTTVYAAGTVAWIVALSLFVPSTVVFIATLCYVGGVRGWMWCWRCRPIWPLERCFARIAMQHGDHSRLVDDGGTTIPTSPPSDVMLLTPRTREQCLPGNSSDLVTRERNTVVISDVAGAAVSLPVEQGTLSRQSIDPARGESVSLTSRHNDAAVSLTNRDDDVVDWSPPTYRSMPEETVQTRRFPPHSQVSKPFNPLAVLFDNMAALESPDSHTTDTVVGGARRVSPHTSAIPFAASALHGRRRGLHDTL